MGFFEQLENLENLGDFKKIVNEIIEKEESARTIDKFIKELDKKIKEADKNVKSGEKITIFSGMKDQFFYNGIKILTLKKQGKIKEIPKIVKNFQEAYVIYSGRVVDDKLKKPKSFADEVFAFIRYK
jgi:hypothetical protein